VRSKVDPEKAREQWAAAAFGAYAKKRGLNKSWEQLDADSRAAWCEAVDEMHGSFFADLEEQDTFITMLKLAMRDALTEDHITQLVTAFAGRGGIPGKVRLIIAPDRISMPFAEPLRGRHDG